MLRYVMGYAFVCAALLGLPVLYYYRPPHTWMDRFGMLAETRFAYIAEPWFQIAMVVVALAGALGIVLLAAGRRRRQ
jgi:hypothetical protein